MVVMVMEFVAVVVMKFVEMEFVGVVVLKFVRAGVESAAEVVFVGVVMRFVAKEWLEEIAGAWVIEGVAVVAVGKEMVARREGENVERLVVL
jgi:hypothetical protein